ncbi:MAG: FG-GAP-like repeat-containing protein, partial [Acidobacteriota bacterium]|nr:FG-GAP-like repeat-containing protein [Acidobacteriota bacterium]
MSNRSKTLLAVIVWLALGLPPLVASQEPAGQLLRQARVLFDQRRFVEAAATARRARQTDPKLREAWRLAGLSLQLAQAYGESEQEFTEALKLFPADAELWFELARVEYLQGALKRAEASARRAIVLDADSADAQTILAMTLDALDDPANALAHYRRAIELCRQRKQIQTIPFLYAAQLLVRQGQFAEAAGYLSEIIAANPRQSQPYFIRGGAYEKLGKLREAEKDYVQAVSIDGHAQAHAALERLRAGVALTGGRGDGEMRRRGDGVKFREVATQARLDFTLRNAASPRKYQIETMTGGVAAFDYDGDGWQDIYFVNGAELPAMKKSSPQFWNRLFHNNRDGSFVDVTEKAGGAGQGFSMGVAVADYDNDGDADLFVAGVNRNLLFRNLSAEGSKGHFDDVTEKAGLANTKLWSVAAAWFDFDNDGDLDLFV